MRSPRVRHHGGARPNAVARKYEEDMKYSGHEHDRRTPFSEYESGTDEKRTVFSEYTSNADYSAEDRSSYSESHSGKRTPYSEYITEYTDETDDDRMSATLGIARNQYCTTLNALVEGSDSSSSGSSYSQSTFASDFDRMCNANVNTNCMATLFNRNSEVPGTLRCGGGTLEEQQKMSLPLPLQYMDHLVPSKQELNSTLDNFAQKFDTMDGQRPGFPQVYKSLFEANLSQTASEEEKERVVDFTPGNKLEFSKVRRESTMRVQTSDDPDILSPPSHIIIKDDFTAVSSAESFGFAPETQKLASASKYKRDRKEQIDRPSPRHSSTQQNVSHRPSPRHASSTRQSPRHSSARNSTEMKHQNQNYIKTNVQAESRHGLDRLMRNQATSPLKSHELTVQTTPRSNENPREASMLSGAKHSSNEKSKTFRHIDQGRQDFESPGVRQTSAHRVTGFSKNNGATKPQDDKVVRQPITLADSNFVTGQHPNQDRGLATGKSSFPEKDDSRMGKKPKEGYKPDNKLLLTNKEKGITGTTDTNAVSLKNTANSIPHVFSLKPTQTAVSDLTGGVDDLVERNRIPIQVEETIVSPPLENGAMSGQVLSLRPTPTAVSELTGEAGDFQEKTRYSTKLETVVASPVAQGAPLTDMDSSRNLSNRKISSTPRSSQVVYEDQGIVRIKTTATRKSDLENKSDSAKQDNSNESQPNSGRSIHDDYSIAMRRTTPSKKAETLDRLQDALMGSKQHFSSDQKSRRRRAEEVQVFTFEDPNCTTRQKFDSSSNEKMKTEEMRSDSTEIPVRVEKFEEASKAIESEQHKLKREDAEVAAQHAKISSEAVESTLRRMEEIQSEGFKDRATTKQYKVHRQSQVDMPKDKMDSALSLHIGAESQFRKKTTISESCSTPKENRSQKQEGDDLTSLSALDNEISLLESQITGLELHDQISEVRHDQTSKGTHDFESQVPVQDLREPVLSTPRTSGPSLRNENKIRLQFPVESSSPLSIFVGYDKKDGGDLHHFKPPLAPAQRDPSSKDGGRTQFRSSNLKDRTKQNNKSTDATLVTAPTVMTMDTPFTFETPLVVSPATKILEERKLNRRPKVFLTTAISLQSEICSGDQIQNRSPIFLFFIVGTRKYFNEVLFMIVAWIRHISSMSFIQQKQDSVKVGLMVPPVADDDFLYEQHLQSRSLVVNLRTSSSPEEPGLAVQSFVPEIWNKTETSRRKQGIPLPTSGSGSIWDKLFLKKQVGT